MNSTRFKLKRNRPKVLFVDDDPLVHKTALQMSKGMGLQKRTAFSPVEAEKKIRIRLRAIAKIIEILSKKRNSSKTSLQRAAFTERIKDLKKLQKSPFALVVSDINMPRGQPTGMGFARTLRTKFPEQKIIIHSDDYRRLEQLEEEGFLVSDKNSMPEGKSLKEGIRNSLAKKR